MENYLFKILLGGCVGHKRTEIMSSFTSGQSHSDTRVIIGVDFAVHCVDLPENEGTANLQIWDFGEEKRFRTLIPCFCQGASGAILYFNRQDPGTLIELEEWIAILREHTKSIPIILCGTNCGETQGQKIIDEDTIQEFLNRHNLKGFYEINVETGCNIDASFDYLTKLMVEQWPSLLLQNTTKITTQYTPQFQ